MVAVVHLFIGEEKCTQQARASAGVLKLLKKVAWGDGWGAKFRGTKESLNKVGAFETQAGGWIFVWNEGRGKNKRELYVDCVVI